MNNEMPLVGDDGTLYIGDGLEDEKTGNGAAALGTAGMYLITAIGAPSAFPSGMNVGDMFPANGTEVLKTGDKAHRLILKEAADITGWSLAVTKDQIDITRLKDRYKKFRPGKMDANGTVNMIFTLGVTDKEGGLVDLMIKTFRKSGNTVTVTDIEAKPLYFVGYTRKTETPRETEAFIFGQIHLYGISFGGQGNAAQSFDSSFKLTGADPVFYTVDIPLETA